MTGPPRGVEARIRRGRRKAGGAVQKAGGAVQYARLRPWTSCDKPSAPGDTECPPPTHLPLVDHEQPLSGNPWTGAMTYIVNDACIMCKYTDCVEVCPVDCFYEGENMLVIHPDECIDCGVCEPECPVEAIKPDTEPGAEKWVEFNREYSEKWPNITIKKDPLPDAERYEKEEGKLEKYFSPNPGEGD